MMTRNLEHQFFCHSLKITPDILRYIRYSALQCHLAAAFCFIINVAWFIFSDLSSDAWAFSCVYTKRYIIYGQNSQSQEFQQNNLLKSCIGSLVESENCHRTASPPPQWANRVSYENAKVSKKLRPIAQNSGHVARSLEHQFFLSIIENYIRYSALHQIFCVKVPSSGCILFHN